MWARKANKAWCIGLLLFASSVWAQEDFVFNKVIEYRNINHDDTTKSYSERFYLNSADNSYFVMHSNIDSIKYNFIFEQYDKLLMKASRPYAQIVSGASSYENEAVYSFQNPYKWQKKNYAFTPLKDTIISGQRYVYTKMYSTKPKKAKRKKLYSCVFILDTRNSAVKPLIWHTTAFEIWKTRGGIPNGILVEEHFYDYYGKLRSSRKLVKQSAVSATFHIPKPKPIVRQGSVIMPNRDYHYQKPFF